jgi:hypothetical protein
MRYSRTTCVARRLTRQGLAVEELDHRHRRLLRPRGQRPRCRALELLEASLDGCTEAIMLAHGFKIELVELVRAGLATGTERMLASGRPMEITPLRIKGAGRRALAQVRWP